MMKNKLWKKGIMGKLNFTLFFKVSELLEISRETGIIKHIFIFYYRNLAIQLKTIARFSTPHVKSLQIKVISQQKIKNNGVYSTLYLCVNIQIFKHAFKLLHCGWNLKKGKDYYCEIKRKHQCWKLLNLISVLFEIILKDKDDCLNATMIMQEIKSWNAKP